MKVLCIDDVIKGKQVAPNILVCGCVYEAIREVEKDNMKYYELAEQPRVGYIKDNFIPLSDIDETDMQRNYKTSKQLA